MKKTLAIAAVALMLGTAAQAQTLSTMLPSLTWPEGDVVVSTKGCDAAVSVCTPQK